MSEQREAFEKWWNNETAVLPTSEYDTAWAAWQAALSSAPSTEPVAWEYRTYNPDKDEVYYHVTTSILEAKNFDQFPRPLFAAPPNLSAAVAAAREQDAKVLDDIGAVLQADDKTNDFWMGVGTMVTQGEDAISALQTEDGLAALREFGMKVSKERAKGFLESHMSIVDRVMKGELK